jgi:hypothetical protein
MYVQGRRLTQPSVNSHCGIVQTKRVFTEIGATGFFAESALKAAMFSVLPSNPLNKSGYRRTLVTPVNFA